MEIKLNQSEIEEAVRDRLNKIFALASGSTFAIDFQATRGPEGFIATISINPPKVDEPKAETVDEPIPRTTTEAKTQVTQPKQKRLVLDNKPKEEQVKDPEPVVETTATAAHKVEVEDKPPFNEGEETATQTAGFKGFAKDEEIADASANTSAEAEPEKPVEQPVRKSLFGGLGKPVNS